MDAKDIGEIASWVIQAGLKGMTEVDILSGFCEQCRQHGLNLDRAMALMDTLHPVY